MHTVTVKGFDTEDQALEFVRWYESYGEQVIAGHLFDTHPFLKGMPCDIQKTYKKNKLPVVNNNVDLHLKMDYELVLE